MKSRDEYVEDLKRNLDEWNAEIKKAEAQFESASAEMSARYAEQIAEMKKRWAEAEAQMRVARQKSRDEWEKRATDFEAAWRDISEGFTKAFTRFQ